MLALPFIFWFGIEAVISDTDLSSFFVIANKRTLNIKVKNFLTDSDEGGG